MSDEYRGLGTVAIVKDLAKRVSLLEEKVAFLEERNAVLEKSVLTFDDEEKGNAILEGLRAL
jgi:hypothetical protein